MGNHVGELWIKWIKLSQKESFDLPKPGELELGSIRGQILKAKY